MTPEAMRALVDDYLAAYNRMDVEAMLRTLHPDIAFTNISAGQANATASGLAAFRALAEQSLPLFAQRHQAVLGFEAGAGRAVAAIAFRAVLARDLPNGLQAGQVLSLAGRSEFEFRDGAISRITDIS